MKLTTSPRWLLAMSAAAVLLAACGGGGGETASAEQAAAPSSAAGKTSAGAIPAVASKDSVASGRMASRLYIVQMDDAPALTYSGSKASFAATKPQAGQKIDPGNADVAKYTGHLASKHDAMLSRVGGRKAYSYVYAYNGFAAELSDAQAARLATEPGVLSVIKDEMRQVDTSSTPDFLGLHSDTGEGFWDRNRARGENVVIGIIDGGITPEHPSFSDKRRPEQGANGRRYRKLDDWKGICQEGVNWTQAECNNKLIGARFFNAGYGGNDGVLAVLPFEFISPRDYDGHGTHTASTAGGNEHTPVTGSAAPLRDISGMAPRARIAAYKVCWGIGGTPNSGCFNSDSVAAIDQAIADGVDVINFSISGTRTNFRDPVEIAFLRAAQAGIFVAASAGNSGPASATVAHPSPWITTVAAGTHPREAKGSVTLGNGATFSGASVATNGLPSAPFINSIDAGVAGANATALALCFAAEDNGGAAVLDPAKVTGKIVLCDRGTNARTNKSSAVKAAGGVGMVLVNTSTNSLNADFHAVPSVHLQATDRAAVAAYAATPGGTATINPATIGNTGVAPLTASFSSRGPLAAGGGDLLKPDIIAPGQDVLAGVAPYEFGGEYFGLLSGTSMSSPHIAGIAALFKELHPRWSPMAIKSALMTSAGDVLDGGTPAPNTNPVLIFRQGAGHVQPNSAADPGLVFDSEFVDWLGFLCGTQLPTTFCTETGAPVLDPSDLNVASIAIGDLAGTQTITRRVTNVSKRRATYTPSIAGMEGFDVQVSPAALTLRRGETKSFTVKFTRTSAAVGAYTGGQLTLADSTDTYKVRVPVVVRPVALAAPAEVAGSYNVTFGYTGAFTATPRGLVEAAVTSGTVLDDPSNGACSLSTPNAQIVTVNVPAGSTYARFSLFDADVNAGADMDLCVFDSAGALVAASGTATSNEEASVANPAAGDYRVVVQGYDVGAGSAFKLHAWVLGTTSVGNMSVAAPAEATTGGSGAIALAFAGLTPGRKYLGSVAYGGTTGLPAPTIVRVDP
jgi:subtilisin family serine protease